MSEPMAYLNGRWLLQYQATLPLHDAGFVYGATVTDLCRTFQHRLYRIGDHLRRFEDSCKLAHVPMFVLPEELEDMAERLVGSNAALLSPGDELAVVVFATPGPVPHYASLPGGTREGPPTLGMHTFRLPFEHYSRMFVEGARLVVP